MYKVGDKVRLDIAGQVKTIGEIVEVKCGCYDYRVTCPEYPAPHGILIPKSEITGPLFFTLSGLPLSQPRKGAGMIYFVLVLLVAALVRLVYKVENLARRVDSLGRSADRSLPWDP